MPANRPNKNYPLRQSKVVRKPVTLAVIIGKIEEAFAPLAYPGDDRIVHNDSGFHLECRQIKSIFKGKKWQEINVATLEEYYAALYFFTNAGFHYFIAAFLIASIKSYADAGNVPGAVINSFIPPVRDPQALENFNAKTSLFNTTQKKVIVEFLEFMRDEHGKDFADKSPQKALRSAWLKPTTE